MQNVEERVDPSVYAVKILDDYPLFGTGGGTFYTAFTRYRGQDIPDYYDHVHNDYVQFLTDTGVIGAALFGHATCPKCGDTYPRPLLAINLGIKRLERCSKCHRWNVL